MARAHLLSVAPIVAAAPGAAPIVAPHSAEVIRDPAAFARNARAWNAAVERAGMPHPLLGYEWLSAWWEAFGPGRTLHLIAIRRDDAIVAAAPLMLETVRMYGMAVRRLSLLSNDHTPRTDFIVPGGDKSLYEALWTAIVGAPADWDVLLLSQVPRDSRTFAIVTALARRQGCPTGVWEGEASPYVDLTVSREWDAYLQRLPGKFRRNLRNRWSRFADIGEPALERIAQGETTMAAAADALRLEASGWKQTAGTHIASDAATERFYATLQRDGLGVGRAEQYFLTIGGRRVATAYTVRYRGRVFLLKTGYDPAYAKAAPSKLMTYSALRDACEQGVEEFDFGGQAEPWKLEWTDRTRPHDWLFVFSHKARARFLHWLKFTVRPALKPSA
jgi:CelD/BcsL family acetyltransferase involved in cellulose biosynthesis